MSQQYKCSIYCVFYKGAKFIEGYLENVQKQTLFKDIEFIFLDCASPDHENEHILPLSKKYNNIVYARLDHDPGLYQSWNIAVQMCSAPIIGNWNIDDRKSINSIEILYNRLQKKPAVDMVYGITYISTMPNETYENNDYNIVYPALEHSFKNLLQHNSPHCMPLWRKNLHDRFGYFDESFTSAADGEFWLRCASGGAVFEFVNHPIGLYYYNPEGRSTNPEFQNLCLAEVKKSRERYIHLLCNA